MEQCAATRQKAAGSIQKHGRILDAVATAVSAARALAGRVAIAAEDGAITTRLKGDGSWLATTRTNHRSSL